MSKKIKIEIPPQEQKEQLIGVMLTNKEAKKFKEFCKSRNMSHSYFLRFAINQINPNIFETF